MVWGGSFRVTLHILHMGLALLVGSLGRGGGLGVAGDHHALCDSYFMWRSVRINQEDGLRFCSSIALGVLDSQGGMNSG